MSAKTVEAVANGVAIPAGAQSARALIDLRNLITEGEIAPGERFTEAQLAKRLGMSRTPIRAAIQHLREEGLIETLSAGGYTVRGFQILEIGEAIELRGMIEGLAARLLAERGTKPEDMARLEGIVAEIDALLDQPSFTATDIATYTKLNADFHESLAEATTSTLLIQEARRANSRPFAFASALVHVHQDEETARRHLIVAQDQHRAVVEAIRGREGARAEAIMREHARLSYRNLTTALKSRAAIGTIKGAGLIQRFG